MSNKTPWPSSGVVQSREMTAIVAESLNLEKILHGNKS